MPKIVFDPVARRWIPTTCVTCTAHSQSLLDLNFNTVCALRRFPMQRGFFLVQIVWPAVASAQRSVDRMAQTKIWPVVQTVCVYRRSVQFSASAHRLHIRLWLVHRRESQMFCVCESLSTGVSHYWRRIDTNKILSECGCSDYYWWMPTEIYNI